MPIYEYKCTKCNKSFEKLIYDKKESVKCPYCSSTETEKQISAFNSIISSGNLKCPSKKACEAIGSPCCSGHKCPLH